MLRHTESKHAVIILSAAPKVRSRRIPRSVSLKSHGYRRTGSFDSGGFAACAQDDGETRGGRSYQWLTTTSPTLIRSYSSTAFSGGRFTQPWLP